MKSIFSTMLLEEMRQVLSRNEQIILFQNRRGYAPNYQCTNCGWVQGCVHCDVSLTYHKHSDNLRCHYCGFTTKQPTTCPACGSHQLILKGFGTEKIEDELRLFLPEANIARMDLDTVKGGKHAHTRIINDFEEKRIDVLIGTQMVTKGLDFDNVALVGILSADQMLHFPDFRASERAFQLITQVAGRAGRRKKRGRVLIQAFNITHPVLKEVFNNDLRSFFQRELKERNEFHYPPYKRLIKVTLRHKRPSTLQAAARIYVYHLKATLKDRVLGPAVPGIPRVRGHYLMDVMIKLERDPRMLTFAKQQLREAEQVVHREQGMSGVRMRVDVDPV